MPETDEKQSKHRQKMYGDTFTIHVRKALNQLFVNIEKFEREELKLPSKTTKSDSESNRNEKSLR